MKKGLMVLLAVVVAALFMGCGRTEIQPAPKLVPEIQTGDWAMLGKFPILKFGKLGDGKIKELGLERRVVMQPLTVYNYMGGDRWRLESLPTGMLVATDSIGRPWYKISCGNRLYISVKEILAAPSTGSAIAPIPPEKLSRWGWLTGLWNFISSLAEAIGGFVAALLLVILALAAIVAAILIARWLLGLLRRRPPGPAVPAPAVPVVPAPVAPVVPAQGGGAVPGAGGPIAPGGVVPSPSGGIVPGPAPNENGVGIFQDATGAIRIVGQGVDQQSITINGGQVTLNVTVRPVTP